MCYEGSSQLLSSQQTSPISGNCYCFIIVGNWFSQFSEIGVNKSTATRTYRETQLNTQMIGKCLIIMRSNLCYDNTDSSLDPLDSRVSQTSVSRMQLWEGIVKIDFEQDLAFNSVKPKDWYFVLD